jgi:hypothetical protein
MDTEVCDEERDEASFIKNTRNYTFIGAKIGIAGVRWAYREDIRYMQLRNCITDGREMLWQ